SNPPRTMRTLWTQYPRSGGMELKVWNTPAKFGLCSKQNARFGRRKSLNSGRFRALPGITGNWIDVLVRPLKNPEVVAPQWLRPLGRSFLLWNVSPVSRRDLAERRGADQGRLTPAGRP